jgi:hypothetical protein
MLQRLICESMHAEVNRAWWRWGAFGARPLACIFPNPVELNARDDAGGEGGFGMRPLSHVPNSSPLQTRFKESTLMSQSCDLFYEGPRKRYPCALGLYEFISNL